MPNPLRRQLDVRSGCHEKARGPASIPAPAGGLQVLATQAFVRNGAPMSQRNSRQRIFGLTGGIGSGKSTVAGFLREAGVPVVDADALARQVVAPGMPAQNELRRTFGEAILREDGSLDRKALGDIVFQSHAARERLEQILHPRIQQAAEAEFSRHLAAGHALVCYEVPLLFETDQAGRYRPIVVVHVPREAQLARTMSRDQMSAEQAEARISAQLDLGEKAEQADFVIDNTGTLEETKRQTLSVLEKIRAAEPRA